MRTIMGIEIEDREKEALNVQSLLTKHGCIIKTRLGLHDAGNVCSQNGFLLLEFVHETLGEFSELELELNNIEGVVAKRMEF